MKNLVRLPLGHLVSNRKSLPMLMGLALALTGCPEGSVSAPQTIDFGEADKLFVQPIQVCNDGGNNCASVNLFEDITRKILRQAQLSVSFLPTVQLNATRFLSINDSRDRNSTEYEFYELTRTGGSGAFGRHPDSTKDSGPINVWFVEEIEALSGFTQFGLAWVDANGVLISEAALEFNDGVGRTDTIAHEISHNLGLQHTTLGAGGANNLMTDGDGRNIPSSIEDIGPDGAGVSQLTNAQIRKVKESSFLNSGPSEGLGPDVTAADLSTDKAAQLVTQIATLSQESTDSALYPALYAALPPSLANATATATFDATATATAAKSVPEPAGVLGLSGLGLLLLMSKRRTFARHTQR